MIIGIDKGHTLSGAGTGAVGIVKETDKNREAGNRLIQMLTEKGHTVIDCTVDVSSNDLVARTNLANAQTLDLFVSLHLNAFNGAAYGVETYIYNGSYTGKEENRAVAKRVQDKLVQLVGWYNRGVKEANYHVLRETKAPAILVELGFCDSQEDMGKWNTENIAKALFEGITNTAYVAPQSSGTLYRVVAGSYSERSNAVAQQEKLKAAGFSSFLDAFVKDGKTFLRVVVGSYADRVNAENMVNSLASKGFSSSIAIYTTGTAPTPPPAPPAPPSDDIIINRYAERGYAIPRVTVNVRNVPSVINNSPVATYAAGEKINLYTEVVVTNAYTWISYISSSGVTRYIAVKNNKTGERYADCY